MSTQNEPKTREEIQRAFSPLLRSYQAKASQIATKAEEAELAKDREVVDRVSAYTVESIVNDLARLQLEFGSSVETIAEQLSGEADKLHELKRAIAVEARRLDSLQHSILAAEALAILEQDHQHKLAAFQASAKEAREQLDQEMADKRAEWRKEAEAHQAALEDHEAAQAKERTQNTADYEYERERQRKLTADANADTRRDVERQLADQEAERAKHWAAREKHLDEAAADIDKLRAEVASFPEQLDKLVKAAREKAIAAVQREAKFEAEMADKQHQADTRVSQLKIQTLEQRIQAQATQIADLSSKLDATIAKSQNLAEHAFTRPQGE